MTDLEELEEEFDELEDLGVFDDEVEGKQDKRPTGCCGTAVGAL